LLLKTLENQSRARKIQILA